MASALQSANCPLRELDLSQNDLQVSGEKLVSALLSPNCKLETLRLAGCKLTAKSCEIMASALQSANSPLRELDLSQNDLQMPGEKLVSALQSSNCKLQTLRLVGCKPKGRFLALAHRGANPHLRELDMSDSELEDHGGELLLQPLNQDCKVRLARCKLRYSSSEVVVSVLQSYISQLSELDMSSCDLQTSDEKLLSGLKNPNCQLEKLRLVGCKLSGRFLAVTLQWANSHLRELDISDSELQDCGGELLHQPLNQDCKVRLISCRLKHSSSEVVVSVLLSYISQLSELDMSGCDLQTSEEKLLSGLTNPNCQLEKLRLAGCKLTEESYEALASAVQHMVSLTELDLSDNHISITGIQLLDSLKSHINCKLQTLRHACGELRKYACELTLDPNTAHRNLSLSEGNRKVTRGNQQQPYPDHPERFDFIYSQVLCREGLTGRCYWEAEWSGGGVSIAVAYKSTPRKEGTGESSRFGYNAKSWSLICSGYSYSAWHNSKDTAIPAPSSRSSRVGVYLDWPAGTVSFYSVSSNTLTHLHTFHSTFAEPLYPGFYVYSNSSVSLCQIT
ncbi:ribonuclease inhibitor-like [Sardina pilchardus]|uniref:ribonuclease inhibitor-like n=1 Tax=Sardina pilchardus TaxID=27697 RepID=UPI002E130C8F